MADLTNKEIQALRATGQALDASFQVGKDGITDGVVKELQTWLSREPLVKVKIHASANGERDTESLARELATRAKARFVEVRGHTALFHRPPRHKRDAQDF